MACPKRVWVALALTLSLGTAAHAEDAICVITALAFDDNLNPLQVQGVSSGKVTGRNLIKACGKEKLLPIEAARTTCEGNQDARFVALFRRIDGVDLVKSKDSKAKFNEKKPAGETATIKMKSCAFWADRDS